MKVLYSPEIIMLAVVLMLFCFATKEPRFNINTQHNSYPIIQSSVAEDAAYKKNLGLLIKVIDNAY